MTSRRNSALAFCRPRPRYASAVASTRAEGIRGALTWMKHPGLRGHGGTWSTNIRTVRGHTQANEVASHRTMYLGGKPGGRTKPHLRDAS
eukprot:2421621-Prymnesium_polylepis.1